MVEKKKARNTVYLGYGSNMGDREENIRRAIDMTSALPSMRIEAVSDFIESKAAGFVGPDFVNCCARFSTSIPPETLLAELKSIERKLGRDNEGVRLDGAGNRIYHSRPIDIDILLYGDLALVTPSLQIPHPRMLEREFVMTPLKQILTDVHLIENIV